MSVNRSAASAPGIVAGIAIGVVGGGIAYWFLALLSGWAATAGTKIEKAWLAAVIMLLSGAMVFVARRWPKVGLSMGVTVVVAQIAGIVLGPRGGGLGPSFGQALDPEWMLYAGGGAAVISAAGAAMIVVAALTLRHRKQP